MLTRAPRQAHAASGEAGHMKRLAILLALAPGCATELTNRQVAKYALGGAVAGAVVLLMVTGCGRDATCNVGGQPATR